MTTAPWEDSLDQLLERIFDDPATAAACRRGLGKAPLDTPGMWQHVIPVVDQIPDGPWRVQVEGAVHRVAALYAIHQQSQTDWMHRRGPSRSFGAACRELVRQRDGEPPPAPGPVSSRFLAAATAESVAELDGHLRGLVTLLRGERIPLDYIQLAWDLALWPNLDGRARARGRWGRDFYHVPRKAASLTPVETIATEG